MKTIKLCILGLVLGTASLGSIFAQNIEQIYIKNGSVLDGYISEQKPTKTGHITIASTKATIFVNNDSLQSRITNIFSSDALPKDWQVWAEKNNKYITNGGIKQLELVTLQFPNTTYKDVFLLEKGSILKFIDVVPKNYTFTRDEMFRTVKNKRPENLFSGINEILVLDDNSEIEGQILEQFPGKDMKIFTIGGEVLSFKYNQIKQIKTIKMNKQMDLWSQIQLLDKIIIKDTGEEIVGFISSRTMGESLTIDFENGNRRIVPLKNIALYSKIPNDKYIAAYDKVLEDGEVLLNGNSAYFDKLNENNGYLFLNDLASIQLRIGETVCIEANLPNNETTITLVKAYEIEVEEGTGKNKKKYRCPAISYQDLIKSYIPIAREVTALGNIKFSFKVEEVGDYVLYIQGKEGYIVVNVIE